VSPPRAITADEIPATLSEHTNVRLSLVLSLIGSLMATAVSYGVLRSQVEDGRTSASETRARVQRLEQDQADKSVQLQKLSDDVEHVRLTTDEMARDLKELQRARR